MGCVSIWKAIVTVVLARDFLKTPYINDELQSEAKK